MIVDLEDLTIEKKRHVELVQKLLAMGQAQSNSLAAHVVLYRSIGMCKELALACMAELARRRIFGEEFEYEDFIETEVQKVPKIEPINLDAVQGLLNIKALAKLIKRD